MIVPNLQSRVHQREWMDAPDLAERDFIGALVGLRRVNWFTRGPGIVWPYLSVWAKSQDRPLRVLDVGCGGGDTAIALAKRFSSAGLNVRIDGCDLSDSAIHFASKQALEAKVSCSFFRLNAIEDQLPTDYDVIMSSLFLHHLSQLDAVNFLRRAGAATQRAILVHDLSRSRAGWWLAYLGVRLLLCNAVCREDGPRSVECAFTAREALELALNAGLDNVTVESRFPFRYVLRWQKPS